MTNAEELIASAKALLLDFDGPVTALMPPPLNAEAAERARAALEGIELPVAIATATDHLAVLRYTAEHYPARLTAVEQSCTEAEVACARRCDPSPEIAGLLTTAEQQRMPVAIVSNNSTAAVRVFLGRFDWTDRIATLSCRTPSRVSRMKPDPFLVAEALCHLGAAPHHSVLVGDSVSDVQAGQAAGVLVIGLAKTAERGFELAHAGAVAIIWRASP